MSEVINKEIYKRNDEDRIKKALVEGNYNEVFVLFKYSSLSKEEFSILQQHYSNNGAYEKQMIEYCKQKYKELIENAFLEDQDEVAEYIFKNSELTEKEFNEIKRRITVPEINGYVRISKLEQEVLPNEDSWRQILDLISNKISKPSFETWIAETEACIEESIITVYAKNDFQREWLEERYRNLISSIAKDVLGREYKILFKMQNGSANI
jgi:hypothetical protein